MDKEGEVKAIQARIAFRRAALEDGDLDKAMTTFTEDAHFLAPDKDTFVGREQVLEFFRDFSKDKKLTLEDYEAFTIEVISEDFALTEAAFDLALDKEKIGGVSKSMLIWKKIDGEWYTYKAAYNNAKQ